MRLLVLLAVLAFAPGCGSSGGGSIQDAGIWAAPSSQHFERRLEPNTAANPTPVTVTVVVQGGGGGDAIGRAADTILPGWGWLVGSAVSVVGAAAAGSRVNAPARQALTVAMNALQHAPASVRKIVRDRARPLGLSPLLEHLLASGAVEQPSRGPGEDPRDASTSNPSTGG
jgi:hypothetical protein